MGFPGIISPYSPPHNSIYKASASGSPIHPPVAPTIHGSESPRPRKAMDPEGFHQTGFPMRRFFWGWPWIHPRKLHDGWMVEEIREKLTSWYGTYPIILQGFL